MASALFCVEHILANPHDSLVRAPEFAHEVYGGPDREEEFSRCKHEHQRTSLLKLQCYENALSIALELLDSYRRLYGMIGLGSKKDFRNLTEVVDKNWKVVDAHRKKLYERLFDSDKLDKVFGREEPVVLSKLMRDICNGCFI